MSRAMHRAGLQVVHCERVAPQPWRNHAGFTRELLAWPDAHHWQLRISVADIHAGAPFSSFPGVDRWFAVVEGAGVLLRLPGGRHQLDGDGEPLHFAGESAPACSLLDGPTRDLNLMARRGMGRGEMRRAEPGVEFDPAGGLRALFTAEPLRLQIDGSDALALAPFTLVWAEGPARGRWRIAGGSERPRTWWMSHDPGPRR